LVEILNLNRIRPLRGIGGFQMKNILILTLLALSLSACKTVFPEKYSSDFPDASTAWCIVDDEADMQCSYRTYLDCKKDIGTSFWVMCIPNPKIRTGR